MNKQRFVVPGEFLTVAEEFSAGKNTWEDEKGNVFSSASGSCNFNQEEYEVSVDSSKTISLIDKGSIITGQVVLVKSSIAIVEIFHAEKDSQPRILNEGRGVIGVSNASPRYVKSMEDEFKVGDIVRAEVLFVEKGNVELTTKFNGLGVIKKRSAFVKSF